MPVSGGWTRRRLDHVVVFGGDALALQVVEELCRLAEDVVAIVPSRKEKHAKAMLRFGASVVGAERIDEAALRKAGVSTARALALVDQDDVGNIQAALLAQELNPRIRLVVRMFNMGLGERLNDMISRCTIMSASAMAAPMFVEAALTDGNPAHTKVEGRTLVARRSATARQPILCGLADTGDRSNPQLLPEDQLNASLVLTLGEEVPSFKPRLPGARRRLAGLGAAARAFVRTKLTAVTFICLLIFLGSTWIFHLYHDQGWLDAFVVTVATATGQVDLDLDARGLVKLASVLATVCGLAVVPLITATVVDAVIGSRLARALGGVRGYWEDHIVVCGLGNVGIKVAERLYELGYPVVAIERDPDAVGVSTIRRLGIPLVIGDCSREETLRTAQVDRCQCLIAATDDDIANLESGLNAHALSDEVRVVLRLFDVDLAAQVERTLSFVVSRSVAALAAPAFAAALLDQRVIMTIPVGRKVLLVADILIRRYSQLDGATVDKANLPGNARVIALKRDDNVMWKPPSDMVIEANDRLILVVTRTGRAATVIASRPQTASLRAPDPVV